MRKKILFLVLLSSFAYADCKMSNGIYTCTGDLSGHALNIKAQNSSGAKVVVEDANAKKGNFGSGGTYPYEITNIQVPKVDDLDIQINNLTAGEKGNPAGSQNLKVHGVNLYTGSNSDISNVNLTMDNSIIYGKFIGVRGNLADSNMNNTFDLNGVNITIKNSNIVHNQCINLLGKCADLAPGESAIYGAHLSPDKNTQNSNLNINANDIVLTLDNVKVSGNTQDGGIFFNPKEVEGLTGGVIGVLAGKHDEFNDKFTTTGDIDVSATVNITNGSNVSGFVKGAEADSKGGSVKAVGDVNVVDSQVGYGVIGGYAGNFDNGANTSKVDFKEINPNSNASFLQAQGNVYIENSQVGGFEYKNQNGSNPVVFNSGYIYGGVATGLNEAVVLPSTVTIDNSTIDQDVYGAFAKSKNSDATAKGTVIIQNNSTLKGDIYGVYSNTNNKATNDGTIIIDNSTFEGKIYASYIDGDAKTIDSTAQIQLLNGAKVSDEIAANKITSSSANDITVDGTIFIDNSNVQNDNNVYANYVSSGKTIKANANVILQNAFAPIDVYGNYIITAAAKVNATSQVTLNSNSTVQGNTFANYIQNADEVEAVGILDVLNGASVGNKLYANYIEGASKVNSTGTINITNSSSKDGNLIASYVKGGDDITSKAYVNVIESNGEQVRDNILGNYIVANDGAKIDATSNIYFEGDGSEGIIVGTLIAKNGGDINIENMDNTIILKNNAGKNVSSLDNNFSIDQIWGFKIEDKARMISGETFANGKIKNTLRLEGTAVEVGTLSNINNYEIKLNNDVIKETSYNHYAEDAKVNKGVITVTQDFYYDADLLGDEATIALSADSGFDWGRYEVGDSIALFKVEQDAGVWIKKDGKVEDNMMNMTIQTPDASKVQVGFIHQGWATYHISPDNKLVVATITADRQDPDNKPLPIDPEPECIGNDCDDEEDEDNDEEWGVDYELLSKTSQVYKARLSALASLTQISDMIDESILRSLEPTKLGDIIPFGVSEGGRNTYKNNGKLTNKYWNYAVGTGYSFDESVIGWFFEAGRTNYKSNKSFSSGAVRGKGKDDFYGIGILGKTYFNDFYVDATLHYGKMKTTYNTKDITSGGGNKADFTNDKNYYGASLGLGHKLQVENNTFNTSVSAIHSAIQKDRKVIAGSEFKFDKIKSNRLKVSEDYSVDLSKNVALNLGASYEYEFDAKAKGSIEGVKAKSQNLKGSSYVGSAGLSLYPFKGGDKNKAIDLGGKVYGGKRQGGSGNINFTYNF